MKLKQQAINLDETTKPETTNNQPSRSAWQNNKRDMTMSQSRNTEQIAKSRNNNETGSPKQQTIADCMIERGASTQPTQPIAGWIRTNINQPNEQTTINPAEQTNNNQRRESSWLPEWMELSGWSRIPSVWANIRQTNNNQPSGTDKQQSTQPKRMELIRWTRSPSVCLLLCVFWTCWEPMKKTI